MKTVLITGASRGIGKAIAIKFAKENYRVLICYKSNDNAARETENEILSFGGICSLYKCDISKEEDIKEMFSKIESEGNNVDVLINNAGIALFKLFTDTTKEEWDNIFSTNVTGAYLCSRYALSSMIRRKEGKIINISSMWGEVGASCEVAYSASKAALIGLTKALAKELAPSNIQVNCISPGMINTEMNSHLSEEDIEAIREEIPLMKIGEGEDIANTALFLASDNANYITGQIISVNGGMVI